MTKQCDAGQKEAKRSITFGAAGQIGVELVPVLRARYGVDNAVAAARPGGTPLPEHIRDVGDNTAVDVTDYEQVDRALKKYGIENGGIVYHMSGRLSASAEENRKDAFYVNYLGLFNVLEAAVSNGVGQVIVPSSIAALGPFNGNTQRRNTPNDSRQRPGTTYGIAKVNGEMWADYYSEKLGLDVRGVRLPGLLTVETEPSLHGTTDYANAAIFDAVRKGRYDGCPLSENARLHFMTMPRAIDTLIRLSEADKGQLTHHGDYNVGDHHFTPAEWAETIRRVGPEIGIKNFEISYNVDPAREAIALSWPEFMDTSLARRDGVLTPDDANLDATAYSLIKRLIEIQEKLKR